MSSKTKLSARDRMHINYCRDTRCHIEGAPGERCLNMDHMLDEVERGGTAEAPAVGSGVRATVSEDRLSELKVVLDLEDAPDVQNPNLPGSPKVRPRMAVVLAYPREGGDWELSMINVIGPRVYESTGRATKRDFDVAFINPLESDSLTPGWLLTIAMKWQNRLNGVAG